jgi:hypothetical protein
MSSELVEVLDSMLLHPVKVEVEFEYFALMTEEKNDISVPSGFCFRNEADTSCARDSLKPVLMIGEEIFSHRERSGVKYAEYFSGSSNSTQVVFR